MAKPSLTATRLRELLHYAPETGVFTWRVRRSWHTRPGVVAGSPNSSGRINIKIDGRLYPASRLAWLYMTGEWPKEMIDHRDTDRLNNRWANLRDVTRGMNMQNQKRAQSSNKSGLLGVHPYRSRWVACIQIDGVGIHLGVFDTPPLAHAAYLEAKRRLHPGNTL